MRTRLGAPNPYELYFYLAQVLLGGGVLLGVYNSSTIERALPPGLQLAWASFLVLGGVLALRGYSWTGSAITALRVWRSGVMLAGSAALIYGLVAVSLAPKTGPGVYVPNIGFGVASYWRALQLSRVLTPQVHWIAVLDAAGRRVRLVLGWPLRRYARRPEGGGDA